MTLGEKIYKLRTERNLSQGDLSELLEVSRQSVSKWEGALSIPDLDKILLLSEIFGVSTDYLLKDELGDEIPSPKEEISESTSIKIKAMYKIIGELESLGDSGETISRILSRKNIHKKQFDSDTIKNLNMMADAVGDAYDVMIANLTAAGKGELTDISNAYNAEDRLNTLRNNLRDAVIEDIENDSKNYQTSVYYMDIVNTYEHMGDFMINVSQDLERGFIHR